MIDSQGGNSDRTLKAEMEAKTMEEHHRRAYFPGMLTRLSYTAQAINLGMALLMVG